MKHRALNVACLLFFFLMFYVSFGATAQDLLSVSIEDPVYRLIDLCSIKGILGPVSAVRPYSRMEVRGYLEKALEKSHLLSRDEVSVLGEMLRRFSADGDSAISADILGGSDFRIDLSAPGTFHSVTSAGGELRGSIGTSISYGLDLQAYLDKVDPEAFPPFDFTKLWDGFQVWSENGSVLVSNGINDHLNFSSSAGTELSVDVLEGAGNLQLSRVRGAWGVGEGSLSLSGTARPIEAFSGSITPFPGAEFHFLTGSLGDWWDPVHEQKMLSIHRIELFPTDWLYLSPWESVVWAKRLELSYLDPLMSYYFGQQLNGDLDNVAVGGDIAITIPPFVRLYFSLFIDEISFPPLETFFTRVDNQYAWQAGAKAPVPGLPWSLLIVQYTKIEPYCYTHYPQTLPQYTAPININYTNDGENIGYHLPPNSDELLVRFSTDPLPGLSVLAQYQLIRHGTGNHLLGQIEGDINTPIIYNPPTVYPQKSFLNDGIYEWINAATIGVSAFFAPLDATLRAQYSYVDAGNYANIVGNDVTKNLMELGLTIRYSTGSATTVH